MKLIELRKAVKLKRYSDIRGESMFRDGENAGNPERFFPRTPSPQPPVNLDVLKGLAVSCGQKYPFVNKILLIGSEVGVPNPSHAPDGFGYFVYFDKKTDPKDRRCAAEMLQTLPTKGGALPPVHYYTTLAEYPEFALAPVEVFKKEEGPSVILGGGRSNNGLR